MVRILVADDERLEREALQFIAQQMTDVETEVILAGNGREAVELATTLHPDIAFLDIKMPVLSGIEAARQIRSRAPSVRIVFLTAFDHFDYAQEAVRLHADDFIIKPADNDRIVQVIRELAGRQDGSPGGVSPGGVSPGGVSPGGVSPGGVSPPDTAELAEAKLIADTVLGNADEPLLRRFLNLEDGTPVLTMAAVIRVSAESYPPGVSSLRYDRVIKRRVLSVLRLEAQSEGMAVLASIEQSVLYVLLAAEERRAPASIMLTMEQVIDRTLARVEEEFGIEAYAGADPPVRGFHGFGLRFANAKIASRSAPAPGNPVEGPRRVRRYQASDPPDTEVRRELLDAERDLLQSIIGDDVDGRRKATDRLLDALRRLDGSPEDQLREADQSVSYLSHATAMYVGSGPRIDAPETGRDVASTVMGAVDQLAAHARRTSEGTHRAVTAARQFVQTHFAQDLSLERIAEEVHLSAFHLSRIFKAASGATVLDYITAVRMDEARRLMRETPLSIKEIAARVGYSDQNYFSRVFRRLTGTTPTAFRRAWQ